MTEPTDRDLEMALEAWEAHGDIVERFAERIAAAREEGRREERARIMTILEQGAVYVSLDTDARLRETTLRTSAT